MTEPESIAASAADRVGTILAAAENSAAEIRREAEDDVRELRARVDAARKRLDAVRAELDAVAASLQGAAGPPSPAEARAPAADVEGARLIALNMALNGTPREETAKYLDENFSLQDAGGLLEEVYASVEG